MGLDWRNNRLLCPTIVNCVVGTLSPEPEECKSYLINAGVFNTTNSNTIAQFFDESVNIFGFRVLKKEHILLFMTDAASYLIKAGKGPGIFYPKMIQITCLAYALHKISEEIRQ